MLTDPQKHTTTELEELIATTLDADVLEACEVELARRRARARAEELTKQRLDDAAKAKAEADRRASLEAQIRAYEETRDAAVEALADALVVVARETRRARRAATQLASLGEQLGTSIPDMPGAVALSNAAKKAVSYDYVDLPKPDLGFGDAAARAFRQELVDSLRPSRRYGEARPAQTEALPRERVLSFPEAFALVGLEYRRGMQPTFDGAAWDLLSEGGSLNGKTYDDRAAAVSALKAKVLLLSAQQGSKVPDTWHWPPVGAEEAA